jgi:large subunit ribosomal protein L15
MNLKRKKVTRQRGNKTHGWGSMKKHRGAGNRGGRGRAGSGKRGDARKPFFRVKEKFELGRNGFGKRKEKIVSINISDLQEKTEIFVSSGIMKKSDDVYSINLNDLKINKLLAKGNVKLKFDITVDHASESAVKKISAAGGKVTVLKPKNESDHEAAVEETEKEE